MECRSHKIAWSFFFVFNLTPILGNTSCTTIGVLGEFNRATSRTSQPFGVEIGRGVDIANETLKNSKPCIQLKKFDFGNSISNIRDVIKQANKENIHLFLGLGTTDQVMSAIPTLKETNSLLMTPTASSDQLAIPGTPVIMLFPRNSLISKNLARSAYRSGIQKIGIIYGGNNKYSTDMFQQFSDAFKAMGGKVDFSISLRAGSIQLKPHLETIRKSEATHLFLPLFELDVADVINSLITANPPIKKMFLGADSWGTFSSVVLHLTQATSFFALMPEVYSMDMPSAENKAFVKAYREHFPGVKPIDLSAFSYDGIILYEKLLKQCPEKDLITIPQKCLKKVLPFQSVTGLIRTSELLSLDRDLRIKTLNHGPSK